MEPIVGIKSRSLLLRAGGVAQRRSERVGRTWKLCFWRLAYFIVTTKVAPDKKIILPEKIIWVHRGNRFTDGVAKSLYHQDNRDFRVGACEGAGELVMII